MIIIVDGTGPYDYDQYGKDFANSFCSQLFRQKTAFAKYYPGPGAAGISTRGTACKGTEDCVTCFKEDPKGKLYLAGYSRGGAAVMQIAKWCNTSYTTMRVNQLPTKENPWVYPSATTTVVPIPIEAMFLIDPVVRDLSIDAGGVPSNVKRCYAMFRDKKVVEFNPPLKMSDYVAWLDKGAVIGFGKDPDRYARKWMGNANVVPEKGNSTTEFCYGYYNGSKGVMSTSISNASHGAVGGLPWPERALEAQACKDAASTLNSWLKREKLPISVSMFPYTAEIVRKFPPMSDEKIATLQKAADKAADESSDRQFRAMTRY